MVDTDKAAPARAPSKVAAGSAGATLTAIVLAAVVAVSPINKSAEGEKYVAYRDIGGVWTICRGHTLGVHAGMTATPAQCQAWYVADMKPRMEAVARATPQLTAHITALEASGDFAFNAGVGRWPSSPMAAAFAKGSWVAGCNAFVGYVEMYRAPKPVPGRVCRMSKGVLFCQSPGLVARRQIERKLCLSGIAA